ncbi:SgcJ/EcaC family oxidoreductase [Nocardia sp. SYP-A9097]|uniref:SgcJ/EcaC family oxidoreductase n=1 Tax=Nocardia sp. SYP-A9097 TaxID=2663237 RepID=UPI00129A42AF|nr:SgcJ/EcaC family oxidoreductase [Nocardia sp. SYP-A9097]MRH87958.1 SgcJ/EcaC family oxidoreductase [Nocardia sp. SYP-A9097]
MSDTRSKDEAAIRAVLTGIYQAWEASDADAFVADYIEDATAIQPGTYRRSKEEVRANMAEGFASYLKGSTTDDEIGSIRFLGRDAAVVVSRTGVLFAGETEVPADRVYNATWVLEKRDEKWLLAAYHNSPANAG